MKILLWFHMQIDLKRANWGFDKTKNLDLSHYNIYKHLYDRQQMPGEEHFDKIHGSSVFKRKNEQNQRNFYNPVNSVLIEFQ